MLKKVLNLMGLLCIGLLSSQSLQVEYERERKFDEAKIAHLPENIKERLKSSLSRKDVYILSINKDMSSFILNNNTSENKTTEGNVNIKTSVKIQKYNIYKNLKNKSLLVDTESGGKEYIISDKLSELVWDITGETKQFGEYLLQKATTTTKKGTTVTAWYSDKIAVSNGPDLYQGLPGLIVRLETDSFTYMVSKINYLDKVNIPNLMETKKKKVSLEEFSKIQEQNKPKEMEESSPTRTKKVYRL